jgi:hypothetical protein
MRATALARAAARRAPSLSSGARVAPVRTRPAGAPAGARWLSTGELTVGSSFIDPADGLTADQAEYYRTAAAFAAAELAP